MVNNNNKELCVCEQGGRFFGCAFLEYFIFENLEFIHPALAPETLWDLCAR